MLHLFLVLLAGLLHVGPAVAGKDDNPFRVEAADLSLAPGEAGVLSVTVRVPKDHHLYRDMMAVDVVKADGLVIEQASFPPGFEKPDPASPTETREQYDMDVLIELALTGPETPGTYPVQLAVQYQGCKKSLCWMPQTEEVTVSVKVK